MSETYKVGDRVEFIENYFQAKIGTQATVKSVDDGLLYFHEDIEGALSCRVKKVEREIGMGDLVKINDKTYSKNLVGVEGIVAGLGKHVTFKTTEGRNSILEKGDTGRMPVEKLDVVKTAAQIAEEEEKKAAELDVLLSGPQVGDTVRLKEGSWLGTVGELVKVDDFTGRAYIKILEPTKNCWLAVGTQGTTHVDRLEVVKKAQDTEKAEARVVKLSEVKVGDLVRVTYAQMDTEAFGVKNSLRRVREGVVANVSGKELSTDRQQLINAYYDGLSEAVYEVLPTPEPEKVPTWTETRPVGSVAVQTNGRRFLTKSSEDSWTITYPASTSVTEKSNEDMAFMFREDEFLWTERR